MKSILTVIRDMTTEKEIIDSIRYTVNTGKGLPDSYLLQLIKDLIDKYYKEKEDGEEK